MTAIVQQPETAVLIARSALAHSPFQKPRVSKRGNIDELAASMREVGVLEPLIVRPAPAGAHPEGITHELVAGHRREMAAGVAGLETVPCIVRDYSDDQVLEVVAVENGQREGLHPLDESDVFAELVKRGRSAATIADKVGRSPAYVAQRLKLAELSPKGRKALDEDKISLGAALLLARVPGKLQDEALSALSNRYYGGAATATEAKRLIEERFMLRLKDAPWSLDDDTLVPKAGACMHCPKRTGNQADLFADVKSPDMCTDPACFRTKLDASFKLRAKEAEQSGQAVLDGAKAKKAVEYGSGFQKLTEEVWTGEKHVPVKTLLKKAGVEPTVTLAQDPRTGAHVELVSKSDVEKAKKAIAPKSRAGGYDGAAERRKEETKERKRKRLVELVVGAVTTKAESAKPAAVFGFVVKALAHRASNDDQKAVLERRSGEKAKRGKRGTLEHGAEAIDRKLMKLTEELEATQLQGLGAELAVLMFAPARWSQAHPLWFAACKALRVDLKKLQAQVDAEERERAKARKAKASKKGKAAGAKRGKKAAAACTEAEPDDAGDEPEAEPGVCKRCGCTDSAPCDDGTGPCSWANTDETLCSACVTEGDLE